MRILELTRVAKGGLAFGICIDPTGVDYITVPDEGSTAGTIVCLYSGQTILVAEAYNHVRDKWIEARAEP